MKYPEDFIEKCKTIYPEDTILHKLLADGNPMAGRLLDDASNGGGTTEDEILKAETLEDLNRIKGKITHHISKTRLYTEWLTLYQEQYT